MPTNRRKTTKSPSKSPNNRTTRRKWNASKPSSTVKSKSKTPVKKWSAGKPAKVKKIESKMNVEERRAKKAAEKLNKLKQDYIKACRGEIRLLKSKPTPNKTTKSYKNHQKKIQNLNKEIGKVRKKTFHFKAA